MNVVEASAPSAPGGTFAPGSGRSLWVGRYGDEFVMFDNADEAARFDHFGLRNDDRPVEFLRMLHVPRSTRRRIALSFALRTRSGNRCNFIAYQKARLNATRSRVVRDSLK